MNYVIISGVVLRDEQIITFAKEIERSCYNEIILSCEDEFIQRSFINEPKFVARYSAICSKFLVNLDPLSDIASTYLIEGLISGKFQADKIAKLTSNDINPNASKDIRNMIEIRQNQTIKKKTTSMYACPKCKCREVTLRETQYRALDEASAFRMTCTECDHVWIKR
jgi:DNA-directed RNA polymerase subunit M/transcription elongation factor TFIIS